MYLIVTIIGLSALVTSSLGLTSRAVPILPTEDPFYAQPPNISAYKPGDIIASRNVSTDLNGILEVSVTDISMQAAYQHLYRTTDSLQNPIAAVTTILVPHNANPEKLLSYQAAYNSANINCGPSYSFQAGANNTDIVDIVMVCYFHNVPSPVHEWPFLTLNKDHRRPQQGLLCRFSRL